MKTLQPVGQCRFCKCTAEKPCTLANGDECCFVTRLANRCNAPACIRAWEREMEAEIQADRERRRTVREFKRRMREAKRHRRWRKAA